jgi:23S rRNA (guanosine2251-2'-O)-methyltransferase
MKHLRDTYITVFGIKPVLEALEMEELSIEKVLIDQRQQGRLIQEIERLCQRRSIWVQRCSASEVSRISKNPKQDQGVVADILAPEMDDLSQYLQQAELPQICHWVALDGITTPANVGLIIRACTGLGADAIVMPRKGTAKLSPLVIKASAGVIFKSRLLKCETLAQVLPQAKALGFKVYGLSGLQGQNIYHAEFAPRSIFVLGNETQGVQLDALVDHWLSIPMYQEVESINVACAASVVGAEIGRRKH